MQLVDWHVMQKEDDITKRHYVYGDIDELGYDENDTEISMKDWTEIPMKDWTAEDMAEITSGLLEDVNKHSECNNPHVIVDCMKASGLDKAQMAAFMRHYMNHMFQTYGY